MSIEASARDRIAQFLPVALSAAMQSYQQFSEGEIADGAKGFTAHHTACKVAIAHIELLIKLARWADLPGAGPDDGAPQSALSAIMSAAQAELDRYHADRGDPDDDES